MSEKLADVLKQAVLVCEYREGDISTDDGCVAATDIYSIRRLEAALCELLDAPSDNANMLDLSLKIKRYVSRIAELERQLAALKRL